MTVKLLTEHILEFLSFKGGCTGLSESTHAKCHIVGNHMSRLKFEKKQTHATKLFKQYSEVSIGMDNVISESCYKGTFLHRNYYRTRKSVHGTRMPPPIVFISPAIKHWVYNKYIVSISFCSSRA